MGPYHQARMMCLSSKYDVVLIQILKKDEEYLWEEVTQEQSITYYTLFDNQEEYSRSFNRIRPIGHNILEKESPNMVFISGYSNYWALIFIELCFKLKIASTLLTESNREDFKRYYLLEKIKSNLIKCFDKAIAGGTSAQNYLKYLGFKAEDINLYYDVVDNDYFEKTANKIREDELHYRKKFALPDNYILASSRFIVRKNIDMLIVAFRDLINNEHYSKYTLVIIGDGEERRNLESIIASNNLIGKVLMPGFKQYHELPVYYAFADLFIHISRQEQWGLVVNEAMASGLPVIVSQECGCAIDLVHNYENGFIVSALDKTAIERALKIILQNEETRRIYGQNSSKKLRSSWSLEQYANSVTELVENVSLKKGEKSVIGYITLKALVCLKATLNLLKR